MSLIPSSFWLISGLAAAGSRCRNRMKSRADLFLKAFSDPLCCQNPQFNTREMGEVKFLSGFVTGLSISAGKRSKHTFSFYGS